MTNPEVLAIKADNLNLKMYHKFTLVIKNFWKAFPVVILCIFSFNGYPQKQQINFEHLQTKGLSQNTVYCILKDHFGFMWFGTQSGLNKFDGYKFTVYTHRTNDPRSIGSNSIVSLCEDREGHLWVTTDPGGVSEYDPQSESFTNYQPKQNDPSSLSSNQAKIVYEDREGNIWIGTSGGLNLFNKKTKKFTRYITNPKNIESLSSSVVLSIYEDNKGNLWVGTDSGLNMMNKKTGKCVRYVHDLSGKKNITNNFVNKILEDSYGNLWLGTNTGLELFDRNNKTFTHFGSSYTNNKGKDNSGLINAITQDAGFLWVASKALSLFDINKKSYVDYIDRSHTESEIKDFEIYSLFFDNNKILWAGTSSGGIYQYDKNLAEFFSFRLGHKNSRSNTIWAFAEDQKGNCWIGTDAGLSYFNRSNNSFTNYIHQSKSKNSISGPVQSVLKSSQNNDLWIGTVNGLDLYHPETNTFKHFAEEQGSLYLPPKMIRKLFEDSKGNLWIATNDEGLVVLNKKNQKFIKFRHNTADPNSLSNDAGIYAFCEDKEGNIWIGNYGGVDVFNPGKNQFTHYNSTKTNLLDEMSTVVSLFADSKGNIWMGTFDEGLIRFNKKNNQFVCYTKQQGLVNNTINSIIEDKKGFLWLSTNGGIVRFDPVNQKFRNYSVNNGLQDDEFDVGAGLLSKSGDIFFGGINGFNVFNPNSLSENRNIPPVILTGFELFNKPVTVGAENSVLPKSILETKEITLSHNQSAFTFEFAALNYTIAGQNEYAYKLEGFDKDWNNVGNKRTATYTNLDAGTYKFVVKGSNNDGVWNEKSTSVKIIITPPFWLTWWFRIGLFIAIAGGAFTMFWFRINSINTQKIKLQYQVDEQTRQLKQSTMEEQTARKDAEHANKELERKNHELEQFAYVASHDLQEPLRTTSSFVELLKDQYAGQMDAKADKYINYILQASERMKVLIKDLLDYSRIGSKKELQKVDCNEKLEEVLADLGMAISEAGAKITHTALPVVSGYSTEIKQLFQNLVTNAIKFKKPGTIPEVDISAHKINGHWEFAIKDNGIGIDEKYSERIFVIFQRLHTRTEYEGSGIGLSHCKKIVELHNGKIWIKSVPGNGCTFHFTLPAKQESIPKKLIEA
ncbi:MAG: two-component regulator propeller domain-containing protein [Ferruginibacter sp.]